MPKKTNNQEPTVEDLMKIMRTKSPSEKLVSFLIGLSGLASMFLITANIILWGLIGFIKAWGILF